jgi:hypothetical protein
MHIFIKTYKEGNFVTIPITINDTSINIGELKQLLEKETNIPNKLQFITYNSSLLNDNTLTLSDYNITHEHTLHLHVKFNVELFPKNDNICYSSPLILSQTTFNYFSKINSNNYDIINTNNIYTFINKSNQYDKFNVIIEK